MKRKRLLHDPYGTDVWLLVGHSDELTTLLRRRYGGKFPKHARAYHNAYPSDAESPDGEVHVLCIATNLNRTKFDRLAVCAHELVHLVFDVFDGRGVKYSGKHDEAFAYYYEWLFRQCAREIS